jgi:hypothetical protein
MKQSAATKTRAETPEEAARAAQNRRKLRASEAVALALLLRALKEVTKKARAEGWSAARTAEAIAQLFRSRVLLLRRLSRAAGLARLRAEVKALGLPEQPQLAEPPARTIGYDLQRADYAARAYAKHWLKEAVRAPQAPPELDDGEEDEDAEAPLIVVADVLALRALERIAATESAQAFNAERDSAGDTLSSYELGKRWDARLDACPVCESADGTIVGIDETFAIGMAGYVHPWCRCIETIVQLSI